MPPLIFDSHLDLAWNAISWKRDLRCELAEMNAAEKNFGDFVWRGHGTTCLPEMRRGRVAVCLGTLMGRVPYGSSQAHGGSLDFPCHENVYAFAAGHLAYYQILSTRNEVRLLTNAQELQQHWALWQSTPAPLHTPVGVIIAMEGADAICEPGQAEQWYDQGLRCASLVHYGSSRYASGTGDDGPVTADGRELLDEFARLGIILDTTHLCDRSFFEALDYFEGPVLASHQNCRALVPGVRQFSDDQIRRLTDRGGMLGIAFDAWMLYPGWQHGQTSREVVHLEAAVDHIQHLCDLTGSDQYVALGSDLDGGYGTEQTPVGLDSIANLQDLAPLLSARGFSDESIAKIFGENWLRFFLQHLPASPS